MNVLMLWLIFLVMILFPLGFLMGQLFEAIHDLFRRITAPAGVCVDGFEHGHNSTTFFAITAGINTLTLLMSGVAGCLLLLKIRIAFHQYLFNQKLGQGP